MSPQTSGAAETREFQAETRQLLDLMIHSIYSNPDTFLREVISNSSDALDKLRLAALQDSSLGVDTSDLHIELIPDEQARTLTIRDNGIGMSRDEVVDLIGTLAKSGTGQMREALAAARAAQESGEASEQVTADLIGQFGIGFYSTFMVADAVTLVTRKAGEATGTRWTSGGEGTYTIEEAPDAPQGTSVILQLKPAGGDAALPDYAAESTLRRVVRTYSDFIAWPIRMEVERPAPEPTGDDDEGNDPAAENTLTETVTLNSQKALWTRPRSEVTDEEYSEFYRHVSHAWDEPLETITLKAEGTFEYQALLFLPTQVPFDLFSPDTKRGVQLYVRRVFIMDDCEELVPPFLRFVKGIVDAQDLSLNVSREILQQDRQIRAIRKRLVKRVLQTIEQIRTDRPEEFRSFWKNFGAVLKEGLISDVDAREQLLAVSTFASTRAASDEATGGDDDEVGTTIAEYVSRMAEGQEEIYYLTGTSRAAVENSPHLEAFRARGVEVLVLTDPVDEVWVDAVGEVDGRRLRSVAKGDVDLSGIGSPVEEEKGQADSAEFTGLLEWLGEELSDEVKQVRLSQRLTESAACMVGDEFDMTPQLEAMYRASGMELPASKRILELNPSHPLVERLRSQYSEDPSAPGLADTARLLSGAAVLAEGGTLADPAAFAKLLVDRI
ncbi:MULTISPECIES: molecular chaperone HtpG [Dietzia]|uniref:molecular chaperone HtpG n=1 Tax=Dietzia TaxID=37914 RepID=UPI0015CA5A94|nr:MULTISPECIES: molecular chaperone HtpG [Dietzia]MBB1041805.1 molecular chaperone HtpG [Dietzia sp. Cai40]MBB1043866.1 molecular chaperone HtpG [Dietzia sp. DQ11-44]MBB1051787.1 molecular chaperone HtpG [Dietzia sp. CW19]MBB1055130.1 molecular chaperone HtpG [Dietzia sp. B44]MCT1516106.1 molecular chaperone HtpG [Dietzia cercidiphylli]